MHSPSKTKLTSKANFPGWTTPFRSQYDVDLAMSGLALAAGASRHLPADSAVPLTKWRNPAKWPFAFLAMCVLFASSADAQSGLRDSLEALDRNENGSIDPDEITPLSRPYLERIAESRRMSLQRPNPIDKLQEAARIYYALQNGVAGERVRIDDEKVLESFRPKDDDVMIPEFGLAEVKYPYTADDLDEAEDLIDDYDRDNDGYLDRREARRVRWTHRDPFLEDDDKDDRLSRLELAQRYARRRLVRDDADELVQRSKRAGNGIRPSITEEEKRNQDRRKREEWWRKGGNRFWLTAGLMGRFDTNRNGRLESSETLSIGIPIGQIDANQDSEISRDELLAYTAQLQDQTGGALDGLPGWFYENDVDRDQQISLPEFAEELTDPIVEQFLSLDSNGDGLLTAMEVLESQAMTGGKFANSEAEMLPPRKTIVSEIEIEEDFVIADLNVQLSITHTHTSHLDGYLTGPDGQRIELFTAVGGSDDHFDETIFDDQSKLPITKARPPFKGSFMPEGMLKRQPGLGAFNGKSIAGVWQLSIRASRSDRFGMLHHWAIIARPDEEGLLDVDGTDSATDTPANGEVTVETSGPSPIMAASNFAAAPVTYQPPQTQQPSGGDFWTAERKAEIARRLRKPSPEVWENMNEDQKRAFAEERKNAIAEYKRGLGTKKDRKEWKKQND